MASEQVAISPIIASYRNGEIVMYSCNSGVQTVKGPDRRICQNGLWEPPLTEETICTGCFFFCLNPRLPYMYYVIITVAAIVAYQLQDTLLVAITTTFLFCPPSSSH